MKPLLSMLAVTVLGVVLGIALTTEQTFDCNGLFKFLCGSETTEAPRRSPIDEILENGSEPTPIYEGRVPTGVGVFANIPVKLNSGQVAVGHAWGVESYDDGCAVFAITGPFDRQVLIHGGEVVFYSNVWTPSSSEALLQGHINAITAKHDCGRVKQVIKLP